MAKTTLELWKALKDGDGLRQAQRLSRILSLTVLVLCIPVAYECLLGGVPSWLLVVVSLPIGWLLAERNALDDRIRKWPTISNYIDWGRVDQDVQSDNKANE